MKDNSTNETNDVIELLLVWMGNSKRAQIAHYDSASRFSGSLGIQGVDKLCALADHENFTLA